MRREAGAGARPAHSQTIPAGSPSAGKGTSGRRRGSCFESAPGSGAQAALPTPLSPCFGLNASSHRRTAGKARVSARAVVRNGRSLVAGGRLASSCRRKATRSRVDDRTATGRRVHAGRDRDACARRRGRSGVRERAEGRARSCRSPGRPVSRRGKRGRPTARPIGFPARAATRPQNVGASTTFLSNPVVQGDRSSCEGGFPAAKESSTPLRAPVSKGSGGSLLRNAAERAAPAASSSTTPPHSPSPSASGKPARQPTSALPKKSAAGGRISAGPPTQPARQAEAPCRRSARPSDDRRRGCGRWKRSSRRKRRRAAWPLASPDALVPTLTG